ncbi:MAG: DUF1800 domain-containing protein [Planctomycetes bacterium]|nr:DUF1800 domain-containing protein [Planctomycetota bacterium]
MNPLLFTLLATLPLAPQGDAPSQTAIHWDARHAEHLLNRAGFGARRAQIEAAVEKGMATCVDELIEKRADVDPVLIQRPEEPSKREMRELDADQRRNVQREVRERDRRQLLEYTAWSMGRMQSGEDPLEERMALFWHGVFTSSSDRVERSCMILQQDQLIRDQALGNYGKLLEGMLKDPALLVYLDNQANRKGKPNENLARELLELFSLGVGNYTEADIKEIARALTGRGVDGHGLYSFNKGAHDTGEKTFLGQKGNFDGDDVARIVLAQPACPRYIARRIISYLEGQEPSKERLDEYAAFLRASDFELKPFLRKLFLDPAFYREDVLGARVQGPIEFMVGLSRRLGLETPPMVVAAGASLLGQRPFAPPNVKGWDEGEAWITTSSLMQRGNLAGLLLGVVQIDDVIRADDIEMSDTAAGDDPTMKERDALRTRKPLDKQAGLKGAGSAAYQALRRVQDSGWAPNLNFSARMQRAGASTDAQIVASMLDDLLAVPAPADTLERLELFLGNERTLLGLRDGHLFDGGYGAEMVLRRLAHLVLSLPEAQLD